MVSWTVIKENTTYVATGNKKQHFIAVTCDSKWHAIMLWHVISVKLNISNN